jgi:hypothetical protein
MLSYPVANQVPRCVFKLRAAAHVVLKFLVVSTTAAANLPEESVIWKKF